MTLERKPTSRADQPAPTPGGAQPALLAPEQFTWLRDLLADYSGVYLDTSRQRLLEHGLAQRLEATGDNLRAYERRLRLPGGQDELRRLAELVLNHETVFFRNGPHIQALRQVLLPEIHDRKPRGAPIRIWSAGCSTGEEAYSLAIAALETFGGPSTRQVEIWATDLSEPALQRAREGSYRGRSLQNLPADLLKRYFEPSGETYVVGDAVRPLVRFELLNLLDPFPSSARNVDIIFCQNVTIYFQLKTCQSLIARFYECLPPGGMLFLGFSETLWNIFDRFNTREVEGAYVYYKGALESAPPTPELGVHPLGARSHRKMEQQRTTRLAPARHNRSAGVSREPAKAFYDHARPEQTHARADADALAKGRALIEQGLIDTALDTLRYISPQSAYAPQALTLIARGHADRGDLDLAVAEVRRALEIDALNEDSYVLLGMIYGRQHQWDSAIQQLERARYLSPESALISFHLAEAYHQAGHPGKAAREYRTTLRKLEHHPPGAVIEGVAVGWLREACQRQIEYLPRRA
ncbi:MAG: tetratricopeptide repeat protein [Kouleothrix sp.]|nr:tetratricopeptide repeat protein [Kouleothrix sp.]